MKKALEYKILKHLSKNDSVEFIDIAFLESDFDLIQNTVKDLESKKLLEHKTYPNGKKNEIGTYVFSKILECKITFEGKKYLYKINKEFIDFELSKITLGKFKRTQIISIIGLFISGSLLILKLIEWIGILQSKC